MDAMTICAMRIPRRITKDSVPNAMANCETRARTDLAFTAGRQRDGDAGRNKRSSAWCELDRCVRRHRGEEIEARGVRALMGRPGQIGRMRQPHDA